MGACRQRAQGVQIDLDHFVIHRVGIGSQLHPICLATLRLHERAGHIVRREDGGGRAQLGTHIGDGGALRHRQRGHAVAAVFHDFAHAAFHGHDAQHFQNNILRGDPRLQLAVQIHPHHFGHGDVIGAAAHRDRHIQSARAERQHTDAAAGGGVAVGADQRFAGDAEPLQMHLMADAVAGAGEIQPVFLTYRLDITVIVGVFKAGLQGVVVDIRDRTLGFDARHAHRFKFQISHGAGGVLRQCLVNFQSDLAARGHIAGQQVGRDQFLCQGVSHRYQLLMKLLIVYYDRRGAICQYFNSRRSKCSPIVYETAEKRGAFVAIGGGFRRKPPLRTAAFWRLLPPQNRLHFSNVYDRIKRTVDRAFRRTNRGIPAA